MGRPGKAHSADLFSADNPLQKGWSEPQPLGQINGPDNEIGANLSADGSHLFFSVTVKVAMVAMTFGLLLNRLTANGACLLMQDPR